MADGHGQQDIRGLNIDKLVKGFADKVFILKNFVNVSKTDSRLQRWYQKGTAFVSLLDSPDTTGITASQIFNHAVGALPTVVEQKWTRKSSTVLKFMVESPLISMEDIKDSDVDILGGNFRDLTRAVANQVDAHIYDILTESQSPSDLLNTTSTQTGWDDQVAGDPIFDLLVAQRKIMESDYDTSNLVAMMNPVEYQHLMQFLISVKGSSIPQFASEKVESGVMTRLLGMRVVVTTTALTDSVMVFANKVTCTYKSFMPMSSAVLDEPGLGKKVRIWEEGIALLTDPKSGHLITDTIT